MAAPEPAARRMCPRAATLVAMSITQGAYRPAVMATAKGFVPNSGARLPKGARLFEAGVMQMPR